MNIGTAWLVIEESFHNNEKRLISVLSARRSQNYICDYIEQTYVDKFASINEKIAYKKNKKHSPFKINNYEKNGTTISCGHDPIFKAYYCYSIKLHEEILMFKYRVYKGDYGHRVSSEYKGEVSAVMHGA